MVRLRHRYITTEIYGDWNPKKIHQTECEKIIRASLKKAIRNLHGVYGIAMSRAGLNIQYFNPGSLIVIIRTRRAAYEIVSSSISLITNLGGDRVSLRTLHTSATLRHSFMFIEKFQKEALKMKYASLTTPNEKKEFEDEMKKLGNSNLLSILPSSSESDNE